MHSPRIAETHANIARARQTVANSKALLTRVQSTLREAQTIIERTLALRDSSNDLHKRHMQAIAHR